MNCNVYNRKVDELPRTNNAIEGFHRGFESMLQIHKPDIWKFIAAIQKQQGLQEFAYAQRMHGKMSGHQQEDNYTRIKRIVCSAQNYNEFEYLKSIALNLTV